MRDYSINDGILNQKHQFDKCHLMSKCNTSIDICHFDIIQQIKAIMSYCKEGFHRDHCDDGDS